MFKSPVKVAALAILAVAGGLAFLQLRPANYQDSSEEFYQMANEAQIVLIGEDNHYAFERLVARKKFVARLASMGYRQFGFEYGTMTMNLVQKYMATGDESHLTAAFGKHEYKQRPFNRFTCEKVEIACSYHVDRLNFFRELRQLFASIDPEMKQFRVFGYDVEFPVPICC